MAVYRTTPNVWALSSEQRAALQPGQWVRAGEGGPLGRWVGQRWDGVDVVQWSESAKHVPEGAGDNFRRLWGYATMRPGREFL